MTSAEHIIEQGNTLFKEKKFQDAVDKYSQALQIDSSSPTQIRVCNNRAQCYLFLKNFEGALQDCSTVLALDPDNEKALVRRAKSYESLNDLDSAYRDILFGLMRHPGSSVLQTHKNSFTKDHYYVDIMDVISLTASLAHQFIISTKVIKRIEHGQYHDVWELEDYFDPANEERKFDIPCPPHLFIPNQQLVEKETQHRNQLAQQFEPIPPIDVHTQDRSDHLVVNLNHKFAQGSKRPNGFINVAFARVMLKVMRNKKIRLCYLAKDNTLKIVTSIGVKFGSVRCKSVTWHGIARGNVVVRDYDYHAWCALKFGDEELDVDFMAAQFDHYTYLRGTEYPVRLFDSSILKKEEQLGTAYADYKGVYRISSRQAPLWNDQLRQYVDNDEYKLESQESKRYFNGSMGVLEQEFRRRNLLPKQEFKF